MIQVTLTFETYEAAAAALAKLGAPAPVFAPLFGRSTVDLANQSQTIAATAKALAGNAPAAAASATSEAAPAPSPRTADPAAPGEAPAVPAATGEKPAAETPTAPTAAAPAAGEPFDYRTLAVAVNQRVPKFGKDKLLAIAKKHGAETFKALPPEAWAAAHADVVALGE